MVVSYWSRGIFAISFVFAVVIIGRILNAYGRKFLNQTFRSDEGIVQPIHILLNLGFYLLCVGLFLWNLGVADSGTAQESVYFQIVEDAALRLGISIFVIGAFHSVNILVLAILNRKSA